MNRMEEHREHRQRDLVRTLKTEVRFARSWARRHREVVDFIGEDADPKWDRVLEAAGDAYVMEDRLAEALSTVIYRLTGGEEESR